MQNQIENVMTIINYIEDYLTENPDLDTIAAAKLLVFSKIRLWKSRLLPDMRASRRLRLCLRRCIRKRRANTGKRKNFTRCSQVYVLHHNPVKSAGPASWRQRLVFFCNIIIEI